MIDTIEALMLEKYKTEPFHNLYLHYGKQPSTFEYGGTCSDKTQSFIEAAKSIGFDARLHTGFIRGQEIHRLARIEIGERIYFADVGNGWPALKLYPADEEISYRCFDMGFRTEISEQRIRIYHSRYGKEESLQLEIDLCCRMESEIKAKIGERFTSNIDYPFKDKLRFSLIVDDTFIFLRDDQLEIYSDDNTVIKEVDKHQLVSVVKENFGYDLRPYLSQLEHCETIKDFKSAK